jgi:hypothetical protein
MPASKHAEQSQKIYRFFTKKLFPLLALLAVATAAIFGALAPTTNINKAYAKAPPIMPQGVAPNLKHISRAPRYVSVNIKKPLATLIAGETGSIEIDANLIEPKGTFKKSLRWDRSAKNPLVVWLATRAESGIAFIDPAHPDRPRHHILVKFTLPPESGSQKLAATVNYRVNPRTIAGKHTLWMDVYGELVDAGGKKVQDMGISKTPFKVDTHLRTKLLMMLVIAAAVFLFIVEWVRVDVVAIAMMVLLPELGLLNAKDTFEGISSNAVMAIIGVMIISYGLNRAGLVNRVIQPLLKHIGKSPRRLTVLFSGLIAGISSVMQNTGAAVLFLPAIRLVTSFRLKIPISRVLMPIGMAAILGRYADHDRYEPAASAE